MSIKIKLILTILMVCCLSGFCYAKSDNLNFEYNISGVSVAKEGNYLVEVSVIVDKKKDADIKIVKQYALLGCLYKGFIVDRISQKPIITSNIDESGKEYIRQLILNDYNKYTDSSYPLHIVKVGKKYRITTIILVAKDALRQNLEGAGVIRKLGL